MGRGSNKNFRTLFLLPPPPSPPQKNYILEPRLLQKEEVMQSMLEYFSDTEKMSKEVTRSLVFGVTDSLSVYAA